MNLTVLADNNTIIDNYLKGEPALSFYLEENNTKILFDAGYSDLFFENAKKLNINLEDIDYIVLSHGHNDHTGGLKFLLNLNFNKRVKLVAHPLVFNTKTDEGTDIGSPVKLNDLQQKFDVILTSKPYSITSNIVFLGEIPRDFEPNNEPIGIILIDGTYLPDELLDDSALIYKSGDGIVVITGCSHSGITNIVDYAQKVVSTDSVKGIIGGFHLLGDCEEACQEVVSFFKQKSVKKIFPCHCTGLYAKCTLSKYFEIEEIGSGSKINFDD